MNLYNEIVGLALIVYELAMTAPVPPRFVPDNIEPKDPPNFCDPALLASVRDFSEKVAVDDAIEAYLSYKNGILKKAFVLYAGSCRVTEWSTMFTKVCKASLQADYDGRQLGETIIDNLHRTSDSPKRKLLQALIVLYSHDRVTLRAGQAVVPPGIQLEKDLDLVSNWIKQISQGFSSGGGSGPSFLLCTWFHCCNELGLAQDLHLKEAPAISLFRLKFMGPSAPALPLVATASTASSWIFPQATATPVPEDDDDSLDESGTLNGTVTDAPAEAKRLHQILQNLQYLQFTKSSGASQRPALLQDMHDMRTKYEDHYEELLTQLCAAAAATLQAWSRMEDSNLLPSVAEAELWTLATKKHCAGLDGNRAATQAGLALMRRATEECCREGGAVKRRRAHGAGIDAVQFDWSLLKMSEEVAWAGRPLMKSIAPPLTGSATPG